MVEAAVGIGVIVSLVFTEILGASAGGIVVPGYIAMNLDQPMHILGTLVVSLATWGVIQLISMFTLLYGKRRMTVCILVGFILGWLTRQIVFHDMSVYDFQLQSIGYIVPGLIANWMERQGIVRTVSTMMLAAVIVRFVLILITHGEVMLNV
jgi:poly-gamma-glutamate biosynthesis protein PgsC/CapC